MRPDETSLAPSLVRAYRETEYRVNGPHPVTLRIDERSAELARLHAAHGARTSAFITAFNPYGESPEGTTNEARQAALESALREAGRAYVPGIGQHPSGTPAGEPSFLVLGLTRAEAISLGDEYQQNAIVFACEDAVPRLVFLR